ncbi:MAG: glycerol-3-phosphate 1-O-acyltransferase PlsY [bacterium]|nr:glycerol-3-phosphate 1-O-acyltransferase PlsY [bacterium]
MIIKVILFLVFSYLLGSIPFAYLAGRILKGIDIREYGSKNTGASNVSRVLGKVPGIAVFVLDFSKGLAPVLLAGYFFKDQENVLIIKILSGLLSVFGHIWTVFLNFKGGKGVAASFGVMVGLIPKSTLIVFIIWIIVVALFRYISLGSVAASLLLPVFVFFVEKDKGALLVFTLVMSIIIIYKHMGNIKRLMSGTENKIGAKINL